MLRDDFSPFFSKIIFGAFRVRDVIQTGFLVATHPHARYLVLFQYRFDSTITPVSIFPLG